MPRNATIRRLLPPRVTRAEVFAIGPRKALMEQLAAQGAIKVEVPATKRAKTKRMHKPEVLAARLTD